jgi:hypothetical protein
MELHPDDRPANVEEFRSYLVGTRDLPVKPAGKPAVVYQIRRLLSYSPEKLFFYIVGGLLFLSLLVSLLP